MTTPSRGQFPRSNVTGARPQSLHPGSFAVNWRDKVIWVGDASGNAIRFSRRIEPYDQASAYALNDFAVVGSDLWRALGTIAAGTPFTQSQWQRVSEAGRAEIGQPYASEVYSGGVVARLTGTTVSVATGRGIVVDNTNPGQVLSTPVTWSTFVANLTPLSTPWTILGVDASGAAIHISTDQFTPEWRRKTITLALILWDANGTISTVRDGSTRAAGDAESLRDEYFTNGGAYRANGGRVTPVPGTMTLKHSKGEVFALGFNWRSSPFSPNTLAIAAASGLLMTRTTALATISAPLAAVQVTSYDPGGAGVVTPLPDDTFSIQYLYATPDMQSFFLQLGQTVYDTQFEAVGAITEDAANLIPFAPGASLMLLGAVIARKDEIDLDEAVILNAAPYGDPFAGVGASVSASVDYYLRDGSRPLTGNMDADGFELMDAVLDGGTF